MWKSVNIAIMSVHMYVYPGGDAYRVLCSKYLF